MNFTVTVVSKFGLTEDEQVAIVDTIGDALNSASVGKRIVTADVSVSNAGELATLKVAIEALGYYVNASFVAL